MNRAAIRQCKLDTIADLWRADLVALSCKEFQLFAIDPRRLARAIDRQAGVTLRQRRQSNRPLRFDFPRPPLNRGAIAREIETVLWETVRPHRYASEPTNWEEGHAQLFKELFPTWAKSCAVRLHDFELAFLPNRHVWPAPGVP